MSETVAVDISRLSGRRKLRSGPKGRAVDPRALADVRALLGDAPRRRDLLIEHLHRIQDAHGHLSAAHLAALAQEMRLAQTEVYEVATFYHHFDVVKEGEAPPPPITVRVCETLSCQMAGADALRASLTTTLDGRDVRVIGAPCIGRCEHAPAAVVGRHTIDDATPQKVEDAVRARRTEAVALAYTDLAAYRAAGGYRTLAACTSGERTVDHAFARGLQLLAVALGGGALAVLFVRRVSARWKNEPPPAS